MPNSDTGAARSFHDATKLSYISLSTKPSLYKSYPGLPAVTLPCSTALTRIAYAERSWWGGK